MIDEILHQFMTAFNTLEEIRQQFRESGTSVALWARSHGFSLPLVYSVLHGRSQALRGESLLMPV